MAKFTALFLALLLALSTSQSITAESTDATLTTTGVTPAPNSHPALIEPDDITEISLTDDDVQDDASRLRKSAHRKHRQKKRSTAKENAGFTIALGFTGKITNAQRQGFIRARAQWQSIISKDLSSTVCVNQGQTMCGYTFQQRTCIDDLFIGVRIKSIDGVGKIAGSAGPCAVDNTGMVRMGVMTFDVADAEQLIKDGIWEYTILHEMAHVLGFGTLWNYYNVGSKTTGPPPYLFRGAKGNAAHVSDNGGTGAIIIENLGGSGTALAHWKEAVYDTELMTGYLEKGGIPEPLSAMTIGSIADLGYTVDMSKAQDYTVHYDFSSSSGRRLRDDPESEAASKRRLEEQVAKGEKIPIGNDIADVPIIDISEVKEIEVNIKPGREADHEKAKAAFAERRKKMQGLIPELP